MNSNELAETVEESDEEGKVNKLNSEIYDEHPVINEWCKEKDFRITRYTDGTTGALMKSPILIGLNNNSVDDLDKNKFNSLKGIVGQAAIKFNLKS